jgi:hypothetical protein
LRKKRKATPLKNEFTSPAKKKERENERKRASEGLGGRREEKANSTKRELARRVEGGKRWKRKVMAWWQKRILFPVKRAWLHLSTRVRVRPRTDANGTFFYLLSVSFASITYYPRLISYK